jgi:hypothetical protein
MKTRYFFALSLLALVFSCGKEVQDQMPGPDDLVTISAILPDAPATRGAGLETKLSWTWNSGDKITVIGETTEIFKIKDYKVVLEKGEKKDEQMRDVEKTFSEKYLNDKMQIGLTNEGKMFFISTIDTTGGAEFYNWVYDANGTTLDDEDNPYWVGERFPDDEDDEDDEGDEGDEGDEAGDDDAFPDIDDGEDVD